MKSLADNGYALTFFRTRTSFTDSTATWAIGNLGDNSTNNFGLLRNGLTGSAAIRADCAFDVTQAGVFRFGFTPTVGANTVWHSGNDGAGSGLDADLWDGQQFSSYLNQALLTSSGPTFQNVYVNGWFRNNNASEGLYNQATDSHFYSAGANYWHINPDSGNATGGGLIFYSAYNASQGDSTNRKGYVYWDSSGFGLLSSDGSWAYRHNNTHADIYGTIRQDGTNTVWHAGNDGSGSGLDADLLDGIDSSQFLRSDADDNTTGKLVIGGNYTNNAYSSVSSTRLMFGGGDGDAQGNYYIGTNLENFGGNYTKLDLRWHTGIRMGAQTSYGGTRIYNDEDLTTLLFSVGKGDGNTRVESGSLLIGGNTAWHAGNDGAGSGLDADLLDGLQLHTGRNNEANKVVRTNGSGYLDVGWINTTSGDLGVANRLDRVYCSNDAYVRYLGLTDFKNQMGLSSKNNYSRRVDYSADSNYWVGSFGHSGYGANETFHGGSGFFDIWSGTNYPGGFTHIHGINMLHYTTNSLGSTGGNAYGWQMATQYNSDAGPYWRRCNGGSFSAWRKIWHDSNDGAGSGLDADTVDGFHGAKINGLAVLGWLG